MEKYRHKIKDLREMKRELDQLKSRGKKIVFTNGCFDILHPGHTRYLFSAKELGDYLIVAVNSDRSVSAIKGAGKPIVPQEERAELLAALSCVDGVVIFHEDNPLKVIKYLMPDILAKGSDWEDDEIIGADVVKKSGGKVRRIEYVYGFSTTEIINRIRGQ